MSIKDKLNPEVEIELGGAIRKLKCNHITLLSIEETEGTNFFKETIAEIAKKQLSPRNLIVLLWGCLISDMPELDVRKEDDLRAKRRMVASWITDFKVREDATIALLGAIANSSIIPKKEDEVEAPASAKKEDRVAETGSAS